MASEPYLYRPEDLVLRPVAKHRREIPDPGSVVVPTEGVWYALNMIGKKKKSPARPGEELERQIVPTR